MACDLLHIVITKVLLCFCNSENIPGVTYSPFCSIPENGFWFTKNFSSQHIFDGFRKPIFTKPFCKWLQKFCYVFATMRMSQETLIVLFAAHQKMAFNLPKAFRRNTYSMGFGIKPIFTKPFWTKTKSTVFLAPGFCQKFCYVFATMRMSQETVIVLFENTIFENFKSGLLPARVNEHCSCPNFMDQKKFLGRRSLHIVFAKILSCFRHNEHVPGDGYRPFYNTFENCFDLSKSFRVGVLTVIVAPFARHIR